MKSLILIMQFLTKLPLPFQIEAAEEDFTKGIKWFPLVGILVGGLMYLVYSVSSLITNHLIAVVIVVAFEIFITGGLHLDGLADTFDGLYSYRDKDRMLEIMKDSRVGTNGVLVLVLAIMLKVFLIFSIPAEHMYWVIPVPMVSRYMGVVLAKFSKYARNNGMGAFFIGKTSNFNFAVASLTVVSACLFTLKMLLIVPIMLVLTFLYRHHVYQKIHGITGDVLGAWIEMSEIILLIGLIVEVQRF